MPSKAQISCLLIAVLLIAAGCSAQAETAGIPPTRTAPAELPLSPAPPSAGPPQEAQPTFTNTPEEAASSTPLPSPPPAPTATPAASFPDLTAGEPPPGGQAYRLPLTIRHLGEDRAVLFFELEEPPAGGYLLYQQVLPEQSVTMAAALTPGEARQQITLEGLTPGAEYLAAVGLEDELGALWGPLFQEYSWGSLRLRTLSGQSPLRVGVFGDASFGDPATAALVQELVGYDLDFVIHTGDVVAEIHENSEPVEAYALKYYQTLAPLLHRLPVYTVIGNHDYDAAARWQDSQFYYYAFPPFPDPQFGEPPQPGKNQFYALAVQGIQFVMLDSQVIFGVEGRQAQEAWLADRLADPRFRASIPVFHVPPFFSGSVHPQDQLPVRQTWHPLFASASVPLALSGHSHHYERLAADGITYIVSGGGSEILYSPGEILPESQIFARRTHFVLLEIHPDRIDLSAIDRDGELFDRAAIPIP